MKSESGKSFVTLSVSLDHVFSDPPPPPNCYRSSTSSRRDRSAEERHLAAEEGTKTAKGIAEEPLRIAEGATSDDNRVVNNVEAEKVPENVENSS